MSTSKRSPSSAAVRRIERRLDGEECILVLQGGGALGAYQAGVYEALTAVRHELQWVAGISIGAINAALIAGNAPERRVERLHEFWDMVSSSFMPPPRFLQDLLPRENLNEGSASQAMLLGVQGFFVPRFPPPALQAPGGFAAISYYDTAPLKATLERLVDFDRINDGPMRLSVGAVNVRTGNFAYFDTAHERIDVRHIMASGALPPGFPPVEIDGEMYWDGGLVSNTPLQYVLDQPSACARAVFQVDLFSARGEMPQTLAEVSEREKDIRFSSRTRLNTTLALEQRRLGQAAMRLIDKLPAALRNDPDAKLLTQMLSDQPVDIVHLIYRSKHYESQSKDYEFSRLSMQDHWAAGQADMTHTLNNPRWLQRGRAQDVEAGVRVFDLCAERVQPKKSRTAA